MARGAVKFKSQTVAKQPQEIGRFRILGGAEAGSTYVITAPRVSIGRGEENEIVISDLKLSRKHAEVTQSPSGLLIRDLGSSNGMAINGQIIKQWFLKTGDKVGIGSTVLEFIAPDALGQMALMPKSPVVTGTEVGSGLSGLTRFIARPQLNATEQKSQQPAKPGFSGIWEKNRRVILLMIGLLVGATLFPQAEMEVRKRRNKKYEAPADSTQSAVSLKKFLPQATEEEVRLRAESYFKEGYREFIEKNYIRALSNFEVALQVYPGHEMARIYKENVLKAMEQDAKDLKKIAKRDEQAGRYRSALNRYDEIRRMYYKDQSNPLYKEADEAYKKLDAKLKEINRGL